MTEKEAISQLECHLAMITFNPMTGEETPLWLLSEDEQGLYNACDMAIKALEEIQKYREMDRKLREIYGDCDGLLDTVVDGLCKHSGLKPEVHSKVRVLTDESVDDWIAYQKIGTVEECREAVEKQKPQKALIEAIYGYGEKKYQCPECGKTLTGVDIFAGYCKWCGQAIIN